MKRLEKLKTHRQTQTARSLSNSMFIGGDSDVWFHKTQLKLSILVKGQIFTRTISQNFIQISSNHEIPAERSWELTREGELNVTAVGMSTLIL
jgi:hypothetical protein